MLNAAGIKNEDAARAGRAGAASRWGEPRRINLRDCTDPERRIILASLAAIRAERARDAAAQDPTE